MSQLFSGKDTCPDKAAISRTANNLHSSKKFICGSVFHQSEAEPLLSEILDGGPDQIDFIVNDQKTVMSFGEYAHLYRWIL